MLSSSMASLELRSSTPQPAPLRVVKRSARRTPMPDDSYASSRMSSGESISIDERIESRADAFGPRQALSVRKRGQEDLTPKATRAPAFRRLLRPERSFVKLPAAPARYESRVQSNGESPTFAGAPPSNTTRMHPQMEWLGMPARVYSPPSSMAYNANGAIPSARFPPPGTPGYGQPSRSKDPKVLVPRISITPEVSVLEGATETIWVAIEVSGQIVSSNGHGDALGNPGDVDRDCQKTVDTGAPPVPCSETIADGPDLLKFGCLTDLRVEVLPLRGVFVTKILQEEPAPTSLDASSTVLILAQIHIRQSWGEDQRRTSLSTISDNLLEDLEQQLGGSHADYFQVRVTYNHPAFPFTKPEYLSTPKVSRQKSDISSLHTSIETVATAAMKRRDLTSQWSPRPSARAPNPLFRIVAAHWGPQRTANAIHEILDRGDDPAGDLKVHQPSVPASRHASASSACPSDSESVSTAWRTVDGGEEPDGLSHNSSSHFSIFAASTPVVVPQRKASLQKDLIVRQPQPTKAPGSVRQKTRTPLDGLRGMPFAEIEHNARPRIGFAPRIADTSQPRVFGANSSGYNAQSVADKASIMKETRTPNSRGGSSAKGSPYSDSMHEFGLRAKMRKGSSTRKSSAASRTTGRWGWGGWW